MTEAQKAELKELTAKLAAREGQPGMAANVEAIRRRIKELEDGD